MNKERIAAALSHVYTDLKLLRDGLWEPDCDSCEATIENIEAAAKELGIELRDYGHCWFLAIANRYANEKYGIPADEIMTGGSEAMFVDNWYDPDLDEDDIKEMIDERARKLDLDSLE